MKKFIISSLCLSFLSMFSVYAEPILVSGTVWTEDNGIAVTLAGVSVSESGTTNQTLTNADGAFSFIVSEDAQVVFHLRGYVTETVILNEEPGFPLNVIVFLEKASSDSAEEKGEQNDAL